MNAWLRYRDPDYGSLHELAMSYFHEYVNRKRRKILRSHSCALDLRTMDPKLWVTNKDRCWEVAELVDRIRHYPLFPRRQIRVLRNRDGMERRAGQMLQHLLRSRSNHKAG